MDALMTMNDRMTEEKHTNKAISIVWGSGKTHISLLQCANAYCEEKSLAKLHVGGESKAGQVRC